MSEHPPADGVTVRVCPDGPLLVSGPITLIGIDGEPIPVESRSIALCRCGRSQAAPLCDATHKAGRSVDAPRQTDAPRTARRDAALGEGD